MWDSKRCGLLNIFTLNQLVKKGKCGKKGNIHGKWQEITSMIDGGAVKESLSHLWVVSLWNTRAW